MESSTILKLMNLVVPEVRSDYAVGDHVRIIEGNFADSVGDITSVDVDSGRATVTIEFFGRPTPMDFEFSQLERADKSDSEQK